MEKIVLDVGQITFNDAIAILIVLYPTGVYYTDQCGGMSCTHPEAEGFAIEWELWDCDLDQFSKDENVLISLNEVNLRLDLDRLNETQENWIPVIANIKINSHNSENGGLKEMKCIYTSLGNCD
jgi:hypothetical protein